MSHLREDLFIALATQAKELDLQAIQHHQIKLPSDAHHFTLRNQLRLRQFQKKKLKGATRKALVNAIKKTDEQEHLIKDAKIEQLRLLTAELQELKNQAIILYKKKKLTATQSKKLKNQMKRVHKLILKKEKEFSE